MKTKRRKKYNKKSYRKKSYRKQSYKKKTLRKKSYNKKTFNKKNFRKKSYMKGGTNYNNILKNLTEEKYKLSKNVSLNINYESKKILIDINEDNRDPPNYYLQDFICPISLRKQRPAIMERPVLYRADGYTYDYKNIHKYIKKYENTNSVINNVTLKNAIISFEKFMKSFEKFMNGLQTTQSDAKKESKEEKILIIINKDSKDPPKFYLKDFICPISLKNKRPAVMKEPVIASDCYSYDYDALFKHIGDEKTTAPSPMLKNHTITKSVSENLTLKNAIISFEKLIDGLQTTQSYPEIVWKMHKEKPEKMEVHLSSIIEETPEEENESLSNAEYMTHPSSSSHSSQLPSLHQTPPHQPKTVLNF